MPFADVEETSCRFGAQTSREVATVLKTEQQSASAWLEQKAGKIERKWLRGSLGQ